MKVHIERTGRSVSVRKGYRRAMALLKDLGINPDSVLIVKNGEVVLADEPLGKDDIVELLSVISGG